MKIIFINIYIQFINNEKYCKQYLSNTKKIKLIIKVSNTEMIFSLNQVKLNIVIFKPKFLSNLDPKTII